MVIEDVKTTPQATVKTTQRLHRGIEVWKNHRQVRLNRHQQASIENLYVEREQRLIANPFSLSATLAMYPDLRESYVPDWTDDQQLSFETVSNRPVLYTLATKEIDPWQS